MSADAEPNGHPALTNDEELLVQADAKPPWRRIAFLALLVGVLLAIVYASPLRDHLSKARELSEDIRQLGWMGPFVLTLSVAVLVAVGVPRLLFCVIAGMALGFWSGLLWTQLGTLTGNYVLFLVARKGGGDWVRRLLGSRPGLTALMHEEGLMGVILARQVPVPGFVVNLALGLVSVRQRDFLIGTAIGQLPQAIPCTLIGAGAMKGSFATSAGLIALAVALAVAVWLILKRVVRSQHPHPASMPSVTERRG
jgi:uncharacterized membrane protein YdjX (TVP38/TMEM64 family)